MPLNIAAGGEQVENGLKDVVETRSSYPVSPMARVFSGIQPTGAMHLGNYLGAVRNWVADQGSHDAIYCVVDLHAITVRQDPATFRNSTLETAALLLAAGLDPDQCTLFVQSHVPEHAELAWILNCIATVGELRRMTQFKDKSANQESVTAGLFDYPVLMAADILLYDTDRVPVGDDQRQHLELARDLAQRFNHLYGKTVVVPEAAIPSIGARVMDLQNPVAKMSKSVDSPQGTVNILDSPDAITKKFRSAVTDSESSVRYAPDDKPGIANLLGILAAATGRKIPDLEAEYAGGGYGKLKSATADAVIEMLGPVRERFDKYSNEPGEVTTTLAAGADKARSIALPVLSRIKAAVGLLPT